MSFVLLVLAAIAGGVLGWALASSMARRPDEAEMTLRHRPFKPSYALFLKDHANGNALDWEEFLG